MYSSQSSLKWRKHIEVFMRFYRFSNTSSILSKQSTPMHQKTVARAMQTAKQSARTRASRRQRQSHLMNQKYVKKSKKIISIFLFILFQKCSLSVG